MQQRSHWIAQRRGVSSQVGTAFSSPSVIRRITQVLAVVLWCLTRAEDGFRDRVSLGMQQAGFVTNAHSRLLQSFRASPKSPPSGCCQNHCELLGQYLLVFVIEFRSCSAYWICYSNQPEVFDDQQSVTRYLCEVVVEEMFVPNAHRICTRHSAITTQSSERSRTAL